MLLDRLLLINIVLIAVSAQSTKIVRNNPFLSRKKRYLAFPTGSNFVITLSYIKALLIVQPQGWNILGECDVPFALPSDTRIFKKDSSIHKLQRREIITRLEAEFSRQNFNGSACVARLICEVFQLRQSVEKSLVRDLLTTMFMSPEIHSNTTFENYCSHSYFLDCEVSFLSFILNSLFP